MNKTILLIALAGTAALCSCAPVRQSKLEAHPPTVEGTSQHSVAELAECVSDNLKVYPRSTTNFVPGPNGGTLNYLFTGLLMMSGPHRRCGAKSARHRLWTFWSTCEGEAPSARYRAPVSLNWWS